MSNLAHSLRRVMAQHDHATVAELLQHMPAETTGTQVSNLLAADISARRVTRTGTRGAYRYSLTASGRKAAQNPNYVHSRFARRHRGRHGPGPDAAA